MLLASSRICRGDGFCEDSGQDCFDVFFISLPLPDFVFYFGALRRDIFANSVPSIIKAAQEKTPWIAESKAIFLASIERRITVPRALFPSVREQAESPTPSQARRWGRTPNSGYEAMLGPRPTRAKLRRLREWYP